MKKRIFCLLLCFLLTGCSHQPERRGIASQIVKEITVSCQNGSRTVCRYYNTDEKMQRLLLYIRQLSPLFAADSDPEQLSGRTICITMTCSDGSRHIYRQKGDRYFQKGTGPWQKIGPGNTGRLWRIVLQTASDPRPPRLTDSPLPRLPHPGPGFPDLRLRTDADK